MKVPCVMTGESTVLGNLEPRIGEVEVLSTMAGTLRLKFSGFLHSSSITAEFQK